MMKKNEGFTFKLHTFEDLKPIIDRHMHSLIHPIDSWIEDNLLTSALYGIYNVEEALVGYVAIQENEVLRHFYMDQAYFMKAPAVLSHVLEKLGLEKVFVMTQDQRLVTLISEWDFDKRKGACFFIDSTPGSEHPPLKSEWIFREAVQSDVSMIREIAKDFFDDVSCGFNSLEERIEGKTIFVLDQAGQHVGYGIIEASSLMPGAVSIGMIVNPDFRKLGAGRSILLELKNWSYTKGLRPVSGCWYYNTLSRKSLESAGMIATSIGYYATITGKEVLPLRTGNPPGELVE
jgi:GNAT superfamily N-acetyltransferase